MSNFIPLSVPNMKGNELKYVSQAIESEWVSTGGAFVNEFEHKFSEYARAKNMIACQSGTAALHLALLDLGVGYGDLVIAPTLTFIAAVNPIKYVGAEPVFMDCDDSLCMDMDKLNAYIENDCEMRNHMLYDKELNKPIRAVVVVHVFGNIADMEKLMALSDKYNISVVEDATEAVGSFFTSSKYNGKMAGTIGHYGAYSFNGNKIITTGGGGMLYCRSDESSKHIKYLSTQAKDNDIYYNHNEIGYNYRMTNVQAAIGLAQLEQLEQFIKIKEINYDYYKQLGIALLPFRGGIRSNHWFYSHIFKYRDSLISYLSENNIQARTVWGLIHEQKMYRLNKKYNIEKAIYYHRQIVNLPCSTNLAKEDIKHTADFIKRFAINKESI